MSESSDSDIAHASLCFDPTTPALNNDPRSVQTQPAIPQTSTDAHAYTPTPEETMGNQQSGEGSLRRKNKKKSKNKEEKGKIGIASALFNDPILGASHLGGSPVDEAATPSKRKRQVEQTKSPRPIRSTYDNVNQTGSIPSLCTASEMYPSDLFLDTVSRLDVNMTTSQAEFRQHVDPQTLDNLSYGGSSIPESGFITPALATPQVQRNQLAGAMTTSDSVTELGKEIERTIFERLSANQKAGNAEAPKEPSISSSPKSKEVKMTLVMGSPIPPRKAVTEVKLATASPRTAKLEILDGQPGDLGSISASNKITPLKAPILESKVEIYFGADQKDQENVSTGETNDGTDKADSELMEKDCHQEQQNKNVYKTANPSLQTPKTQIKKKSKLTDVENSSSDESFRDLEKVKLHIEEEDPLVSDHKGKITPTGVDNKASNPKYTNTDQNSEIKDSQSKPSVDAAGQQSALDKKPKPKSEEGTEKNLVESTRDETKEIKEDAEITRETSGRIRKRRERVNTPNDETEKKAESQHHQISETFESLPRTQATMVQGSEEMAPTVATAIVAAAAEPKPLGLAVGTVDAPQIVKGVSPTGTPESVVESKEKPMPLGLPVRTIDAPRTDKGDRPIGTRKHVVETKKKPRPLGVVIGTIDSPGSDEGDSPTGTREAVVESNKKTEERHQGKIKASEQQSRAGETIVKETAPTLTTVFVSAAAVTKPSESASQTVQRIDESDNVIKTTEPACEQLIQATEFVSLEQAQVATRQPVFPFDRDIQSNQGRGVTNKTEKKNAKTEPKIKDEPGGNFEAKGDEVLSPEIQEGKTEKEKDKGSSASPHKQEIIIDTASPHKHDIMVEPASPDKQDIIIEAATPDKQEVIVVVASLDKHNIVAASSHEQDIVIGAVSPDKQSIITKEAASPHKHNIIVDTTSPHKQDIIAKATSPDKQDIILEAASPDKQDIIEEAASPDKQDIIEEADRSQKIIKSSLFTDEQVETKLNAAEISRPNNMADSRTGEITSTIPNEEETEKAKKKKKDKKKRRRKGKQKSVDAEDTTKIETATETTSEIDTNSSKEQNQVTSSSKEDTEKSTADESGDSGGNAFEKHTLQHQTTVIERKKDGGEKNEGSSNKPIDVCELLLQSNEFKNQDPCSAATPKKEGLNKKKDNPTVTIETNLSVDSPASSEILSDEPTPTNDRSNELRAFYMPVDKQQNIVKLFCVADSHSVQEDLPREISGGEIEVKGLKVDQQSSIENKQQSKHSSERAEEEEDNGGEKNADDVTKGLQKGRKEKDDYKRNVRISLTSEEVSEIFEKSKTRIFDRNLATGEESASQDIGNEDDLKGTMSRSDDKKKEEKEEEESKEEKEEEKEGEENEKEKEDNEEKQKETADNKKPTKNISNLTLSDIDSSLPETLPELADLQNFLEYIKIGEQPVGVETPPFSPRTENGRSSPNENSNSRRLSRISPAVTERSVTESDLDISEQRDDLSTDSNIFADDEDESSSELLFTKTYTEPEKGGEVCVSCTVVNTNADDDDSDEFWAESSATEEVYRQIETSTKAVTTVFDNARLQMQDIHTHLQNLRLQMERLQESLDNASIRSQEYYSMDNEHVSSQEFYSREKGLLVSQEYFSKRRKVPVTTEEYSPVDIGPVLTEEYYSSTLGKPPLL